MRARRDGQRRRPSGEFVGFAGKGAVCFARDIVGVVGCVWSLHGFFRMQIHVTLLKTSGEVWPQIPEASTIFSFKSSNSAFFGGFSSAVLAVGWRRESLVVGQQVGGGF